MSLSDKAHPDKALNMRTFATKAGGALNIIAYRRGGGSGSGGDSDGGGDGDNANILYAKGIFYRILNAHANIQTAK